MTSRFFLNLRSAGSSTPNTLQPRLISALPLYTVQSTPPESGQATSDLQTTAVALDTTLFAMVSGMERSGFSDQEQMLSWGTTEAKPSQEFSGGSVAAS